MLFSNLKFLIPRRQLLIIKREHSCLAYVFYIIAFFLPFNFIGQTTEDSAPYYKWFDDIIGSENTDIHYGVVYFEKHRARSKKSKFFPNADFSSGSVLFGNTPHYGLDLKYNVYEDELLMRVVNRLGGGILQLYKEKVKAFEINGHRFIQVDTSKNENHTPLGFYELLYEKSTFSLLKKHRRLLKLDLGSKLTFYEFEVLPFGYVLAMNDNYYPVKKGSDLKSLFPDNAVQIMDFIRNRPKAKNTEEELIGLLDFLFSLQTEGTSKALPK